MGEFPGLRKLTNELGILVSPLERASESLSLARRPHFYSVLDPPLNTWSEHLRLHTFRAKELSTHNAVHLTLKVVPHDTEPAVCLHITSPPWSQLSLMSCQINIVPFFYKNVLKCLKSVILSPLRLFFLAPSAFHMCYDS